MSKKQAGALKIHFSGSSTSPDDPQNKHARSRLFHETLPTALAIVLCLAVFVTICFLSHRKYLCLDYTHFDLLDLMQYGSALREGGIAEMRKSFGPYLLGMLIEPGVVVGAIATVMVPGAHTLLFLNILPFAAGLLLAFWIVRHLTKSAWAALAAVGALAANPYFWAFFSMGYRSTMLTMPLYLGFILAELKQKHRLALMLIIPAALTKVTLMFSFAMIGLVLWVLPPRRRIGLPIFLVCITLFALFAGVGSVYSKEMGIAVTPEMLHIGVFGSTVKEAFLTILTSPILVLTQIFSKANLCHLVLLASFLFLPFVGGRYFYGAFTEFGMILISTTSMVAGTFYQNIYPGIFQPMLYIHNNYFYIAGILMAGFCLGFARIYNRLFCGKFGPQRAALFCAAVFLAMAAIRFFWPVMVGGPIPANIHFDGRYYVQTAHDRTGWEIAGTIPNDAFVRVQWNLFAKGITDRTRFRAYEWNQNDIVEDVILIDLFTFEYLMNRGDYLHSVERLLKRQDYAVERFEDGYVLFRKGNRGELSDQVLEYLGNHKTELMKNHYRPYRSRLLPEPTVGVDVYSVTQLTGSAG